MSTFSVLIDNVIIPQVIAKAIIIFCCFPVHECAHAWVAARLGDNTAERIGRITLNPFKHLDLWGTFMLIAFGAGYAKSVPVNTYNFREPKKDYAIVSLAGPMSNLILAVTFLLVEHVVYAAISVAVGYGTVLAFIIYCLRCAAYINFGLTVFNLIPIPPLDGYHVLMSFVPNRLYYRAARLERYSVYMLLGLFLVFIFSGISPVTTVAQSLFNSVDNVYSVLFQSWGGWR